MIILKRYFRLLKIEVYKNFKDSMAYPLEFILNTLIFITVFTAIMFGINKIGDKSQILSFSLVPIITTVVIVGAQSIRTDIQIGVFEQIYNSCYSIPELIIIRTLVSILFTLPIWFVMIFIANSIFCSVNLSVLFLITNLVLVIVTGISLSMILVGLLLRFKKLDSIFNILNILLIIEVGLPFLALTEVTQKIIYMIVPFSGTIACMQSFLNKAATFNFNNILLISILNTLIYAILSIILYRYFYNETKKNGTLGVY
ncbi:hypothetical protein [Clostridium sp.]|uniref:hypothetical protein n=1 Tax=Clostridium sp. TaxID=1506 RepID=UPI00284F77FF|nr:hypothetical protein [Clostridium sp.]MDR3596031.1 hypothetical protein [Clostridium sp.]